MHTQKTLKAIPAALILLSLFSCYTIPSRAQLDNNKAKIKTVALLPLVLGDKKSGTRTLGGREAVEFQKYWAKNFYKLFRQKIVFIDDIVAQYPDGDFTVSAEEVRSADYGALCEKLGVDAVIGFNLLGYNEVEPGTRAVEMACACLIEVFGGTGFYEQPVVNYRLHTFYLNIEDWNPLVNAFAPGLVPTIAEQRAIFINSLIEWIDVNHPLSAHYKPEK
jgi:hypothetical protein